MSLSTGGSTFAEDPVDDDWEEQMRTLAEAEKWEHSLVNIPDELREDFKKLMGTLGIQQRISTYKLLDSLGWDDHYCESFYIIIQKLPIKLVENVLNLFRRVTTKLLTVVVELLLALDAAAVVEILTEVSLEETDLILDFARFLSLHELSLMAHSMNVMQIKGYMQMMRVCNEPACNVCRLCRQKRIYQLEFKMNQHQVPKDMIPQPGTLVLYDTVQDQWTADDDTGYVFDHISGGIYWNKWLVDIIRICEKCLEEVHGSIASECRFAEFHHIDATVRKTAIRELRLKEQARAALFHKVSREREHRRAREIALRVIAAHKHGLRQEEEEAERQQAEREREEFLQRNRDAKAKLVGGAMNVDEKWKVNQFRSDMHSLQVMHDSVNLAMHPGFSDDNPVVPVREHKYSWQLAHYDTFSKPTVTGQPAHRNGPLSIETSGSAAGAATGLKGPSTWSSTSNLRGVSDSGSALIGGGGGSGGPSMAMKFSPPPVAAATGAGDGGYAIIAGPSSGVAASKSASSSSSTAMKTGSLIMGGGGGGAGSAVGRGPATTGHTGGGAPAFDRSFSRGALGGGDSGDGSGGGVVGSLSRAPSSRLGTAGAAERKLGLEAFEQQMPLPLTEGAAAKRFGLSDFELQDNFEALQRWKEDGDYGHQEHLRRVEAEKNRIATAKKKQFEETVDYVRERIRDIDRRGMRDHRHAEQAEIDRLEKRQEDRARRRALRIAGYEAAERELMAAEDLRSWWRMYDEKDYAIQCRERENMWNAECEQTEIDSFWGFYTAARLEQEAIERRTRAYDAVVEKLRVDCIQARIIPPYRWEVAEEVHRDFFHPREVIGKKKKNKWEDFHKKK